MFSPDHPEQSNGLPAALTMSADAVVRGKRDDLLDRMEELARWRVLAEGEANTMSDKIRTWDLPDGAQSTYILSYRRLFRQLSKANRVAETLNAELHRRM